MVIEKTHSKIPKSKQDIQKEILQEKIKGTPDVEIGRKYGVSYRYIEQLITKSQGINISTFMGSKKIKTLFPKEFKEEQTTVWSFKQRGNWATHSGEYRGNWSPYIPRNVILKYSKPGELVLDYFCGAGTTAVECKLLGRQCIALDINDKAIELARENLNFTLKLEQSAFINELTYPIIYEPDLRVHDARDLSFLSDNSIDLICAHPPYTNIIHYTDSKRGDLSSLGKDEFLREMTKIARESFRILKPGRQCAILIGDMRKQKHVIPLGFDLMNVYLNAGFKLRELVIKRQHNCKTTGFWYANSVKHNFLLLAHEYLPIFEKPESDFASGIGETIAEYIPLMPTFVKPTVKKKLDELETTTVWLFPEKDFEKRLNKNVIDRYANGHGHSTITFASASEDNNSSDSKTGGGKKGLLFIKLLCKSNESSQKNIDHYLQGIKKFITSELKNITKDGFVVIHTQDIRIGEYIEPMAKRIVDMVSLEDLWLKEIIVVANNTNLNSNEHILKKHGNLKINHQYIIVYEIRR